MPGEERSPSVSAPGRSGWLKWLLVASLALNLLIVGGAIGHRLLGHQGGWRGPRGGDELSILGYVRGLPEVRRTELRKLVQAERPRIQELRNELVRARIAALEALSAEPFDRDKARASLDSIGEADRRLKAAGLGSLLTAAEAMTPEERAGLVTWWRERRASHFRLREKGRGPGGGGPDEDGRGPPD